MNAKTKRLSSDLNKPEALILVENSTKNKQQKSEERMWPSLTVRNYNRVIIQTKIHFPRTKKFL